VAKSGCGDIRTQLNHFDRKKELHLKQLFRPISPQFISGASVSPHRRHKHHHSLAELSQNGMMGFNYTPEARDARLKSLLGRMSPEEQLDKYLRSVQISQATTER